MAHSRSIPCGGVQERRSSPVRSLNLPSRRQPFREPAEETRHPFSSTLPRTLRRLPLAQVFAERNKMISVAARSVEQQKIGNPSRARDKAMNESESRSSQSQRWQHRLQLCASRFQPRREHELRTKLITSLRQRQTQGYRLRSQTDAAGLAEVDRIEDISRSIMLEAL